MATTKTSGLPIGGVKSTTETFPSGTATVRAEVVAPSASGRYPAVIVVHGTDELIEPFGTMIRNFADSLAVAGFVALIPRYLDRTRTMPGIPSVWEALSRSQDTWVEVLADAAQFATGRSNVRPGTVGVVGFSLGGNLALRFAMQPTALLKPGAVVDFFGPISMANGIGSRVDLLPFVQIHQGLDDSVVPPSQSAELKELLNNVKKREGIDYFYFEYKGEGHGFIGAKAIADSTERTVEFLHEYLD